MSYLVTEQKLRRKIRNEILISLIENLVNEQEKFNAFFASPSHQRLKRTTTSK